MTITDGCTRCWPGVVRIVQCDLGDIDRPLNWLATHDQSLRNLLREDGVIRLPVDVSPAAHCVVTVLDSDLDAIRKQSQLQLPESTQRRMSELLLTNREGTLTDVERTELNLLSEEFDAATLIKGRAMAALARLNGGA